MTKLEQIRKGKLPKVIKVKNGLFIKIESSVANVIKIDENQYKSGWYIEFEDKKIKPLAKKLLELVE